MFIRYKFEKIVRDNAVALMEQDGFIVSYDKIENDDLIYFLKEKLVEEVKEVKVEEKKENLIKEIADVYEVLKVLCNKLDISEAEIKNAMQKKNNERGSFEQGIFVDYVQTNVENGSCNHNYLMSNESYKKELFVKHVIDFCIVNQNDGSIFIQKRSGNRKHSPNKWELPGGKLEVGETFEDCIKRELKEETNLTLIENYGIIYDGSYNLDNEHCAYSCYLIVAEGDVKLEEGKAVEYKWVKSIEEAKELLIYPTEETNVTFEAISEAFEIIQQQSDKLYE